jgi:hypothetical protein
MPGRKLPRDHVSPDRNKYQGDEKKCNDHVIAASYFWQSGFRHWLQQCVCAPMVHHTLGEPSAFLLHARS